MKRNILVIFLFIGVISCNQFEASYSPNETDSYSWQSKIPNYAQSITVNIGNNQTIDLSRIGFIHNEVLDKTKELVVLNSCSREEFQQNNMLINSTLRRYSEFQSLHEHNFDFSGPESFITALSPCEIRSRTEFENKLRSQISGKIRELEALNLLHAEEIKILETMLVESVDRNRKPPLEDFLNQLESIDGAFMDGLFTSSMITIFQYSYSYWEDYSETKYNGVELRAGGILGAALMDWGGAMYEGYSWIYDNRDCVECGDADEFAEQVGKGAIGSSVPVVGNAINRWIWGD